MSKGMGKVHPSPGTPRLSSTDHLLATEVGWFGFQMVKGREVFLARALSHTRFLRCWHGQDDLHIVHLKRRNQ